MRAPVLIILAGLALGAAACATPPAAPVALGPLPSPLPTEGYDWFLTVDDGTARLAYGVEESDDLKLGLDCRRRSGQLDLTALADENAKPEIHLESGGDTERFPAISEPDLLHDGVILTAEASSGNPVFLRFRRLGWVALRSGEARETYVPHPGSTDRIERFFAFCG